MDSLFLSSLLSLPFLPLHSMLRLTYIPLNKRNKKEQVQQPNACKTTGFKSGPVICHISSNQPFILYLPKSDLRLPTILPWFLPYLPHLQSLQLDVDLDPCSRPGTSGHFRMIPKYGFMVYLPAPSKGFQLNPKGW